AAAPYTNHAELTGYTLPDGDDGDATPATERRGERGAKTNETVHLDSPQIVKEVQPDEAPVGDMVTYDVTLTLPPNANFYDVTFTDTLPEGVVADESTFAYEFVDDTDSTWPNRADTPGSMTMDVSGQNITWVFHTGEDGAGDEITTFATHADSRVVQLSFEAQVTGDVTSGSPENVATFGWNMYQDGGAATRETVEDRASVTILNPELELVKKISHAGEDDWQDAITLNPDGTFDYRISVRNTGNTPAHNIVVADEVPAGVIVDPNTISDNGALADTGSDGQSGTITWSFEGPLPVHGEDDDDVLTVTYSGSFVSSEALHELADGLDGVYAQVNTASITQFESFEQDGWIYTPGGENPDGSTVEEMTDDAQTTPVFPYVELEKSVTDG
ncbi:MAG TPA: isopeptide-forming domain-containing fimbrial protein, partial [Beutenbergiaceae bacterium]|nr:isopeptide-forming domain-containing fimbrial protein [Beutenbergiaceae bacterium]